MSEAHRHGRTGNIVDRTCRSDAARREAHERERRARRPWTQHLPTARPRAPRARHRAHEATSSSCALLVTSWFRSRQPNPAANEGCALVQASKVPTTTSGEPVNWGAATLRIVLSKSGFAGLARGDGRRASLRGWVVSTVRRDARFALRASASAPISVPWCTKRSPAFGRTLSGLSARSLPPSLLVYWGVPNSMKTFVNIRRGIVPGRSRGTTHPWGRSSSSRSAS